MARADLIALYAFEAELLAIPTRVTQPLLAEMRFTWWSEQMDGLFAGTPRKGHPVLEGLARAQARRPMDRGVFDALIEAHIGRVHGEPHDMDAFYGGPMRLAAHMLTGTDQSAAVEGAAQIWGWTQTGRYEVARAALGGANASLMSLPTAGFPAVAHATLSQPEAPEVIKKIKITWAVLRGRL